MKPMAVIGIVLVVLGIASFFVTIPHKERHTLGADNTSFGITLTTDERVPAWVSGLLLVGGGVLIGLGCRRKA